MTKKDSLKEIAYKTIKEKIVNCTYPPSSFLNETSLMEEIGASRTPIREALSRLEQENLVTILPKRGVVVSEMSMNEIFMIYETRALMEPYIIGAYGSTIPREALLQIRNELSDLTENSKIDDVYRVDDRLHRLFINCSNNKYLSQCMDHIYDQNHRLRILSGRVAFRLDESHKEHLAIIDHLLANDLQSAAAAMKIHLDRSKDASLKALLEKGGQSQSPLL